MKHLPLKSVMLGLNIIRRGEGYELSNPAGTAWYDAHGVRGKVEGIPEYFPKLINFTDKQAPVSVSGGRKLVDADGRVRVVLGGLIESPQKEVAFQADHFTLTSGEVKMADAISGNARISANTLKQPQSGNVITVNINTHHNNEALSEVIEKAIQSSLRPGGLIHGSIQKR